MRIIAEAGVRLVADRRGLGASIKREFRGAIKEAIAEGGFFDAFERDSDRSSRRVGSQWKKVLGGIASGVGNVFAGFANIGKLLLIGTALAGALASVTSLTLAVGALGAAFVQASGLAALLPAAMAGLVVVSSTVKLAMAGMGDAMKAVASGDAAAFDEALKNLSPAARDFARSVRDVKPAFDAMRLDVQQQLFEALGDVVRPLADTYLPIFGAAFEGIARNIGIAGRDVADFLLQAEQTQRVSVFTANLQEAFIGLRSAIVPAVSAILDVVTTGSTFLPRLTNSISQFAQNFASKIRTMSENGQLEEFFNRAIAAAQTLGRIFGNVFEGIGNIMSAAEEASGGLLQNIEHLTQKFADFTGSAEGHEALVSFFESMRRVVDALSPAFFELVTVIGRDFVPILATIAEAIGPVLQPIFAALGGLLRALAPLLKALAQAFATVLAAFEPVIDAFSKAINDAMPTLGPIIRDIGTAFANLVKSLAPLAPVFVDLLVALLPIVPPLVQMVADIMPKLIELIKAVIPYVQGWAQVMITLIPIFADIVNVILTVLVPVIQVIATVLGAVLTFAAGVIKGLWDVIVTVFTAIRDFVVWIWNGIGDFFSGIFSTIGDLFSDGIGGLVGKVGEWFSQIWSKITTAMGNILKAVGDALTGVAKWFLDLPGKILGAIGDAARWLYDTGRDLIQGLINGIKDMISNLIGAVTGAVDGAVGAARKGFGTHSPSTVFRDIGIDVGQGLVNGMSAMSTSITDAAVDMVSAAMAGTDGFGSINFTGGGATGAAGVLAAAGTIVNQTNVMQPGADVKQFSDLVLRRGMGDFLSAASTLTVARTGVQAGVNDQWIGAR